MHETGPHRETRTAVILCENGPPREMGEKSCENERRREPKLCHIILIVGVNKPLILRDDSGYEQRLVIAGSFLLFKYKDDRNIWKEIKDLRYNTRFFLRQYSVQRTVVSSLVRLQFGLCHVSIIHTGALSGSP